MQCTNVLVHQINKQPSKTSKAKQSQAKPSKAKQNKQLINQINMITIENLEFSYPKNPVFKGINLELKEGCIYGLLGQNGVGKTTLLKIISGLIKSDGGKCVVNGANPFLRQPDFLKDIYYVSEDFVGPDQPVETFVKNMGGFYPNFDLELFYKLMAIFEVNPASKFTKLSYGQQKKAIISVAMSLRTRLLLLDEPSNGLDIPSKSQLRRVIAESATEESTIVISTHQVRDLENLIDPIIILDKEEVLLDASIEKISEKLYFSLDSVRKENALYCEPALGGYMMVTENEDGRESKVNIESLFNAVLLNKAKIKILFR